jgi:hypothetical protein
MIVVLINARSIAVGDSATILNECSQATLPFIVHRGGLYEDYQQIILLFKERFL